MRPSQYPQLCALARRILPDASEAEDVVQEAYLVAFESGHRDFEAVQTRQWLVGTVRNKAKMALRTSVRRQRRESQWAPPLETDLIEPAESMPWLNALSAPLKAVVVLALSGHNRQEVQYLLRLSNAALRQRIVALKRCLRQAGVTMPGQWPDPMPNLAYGRLRQGLQAKLRQGGIFASHDPDGHLFIISRSQNSQARQ